MKPYGNGLRSDVLVKLHEEGCGDTSFSASLELCFTNNPFAGASVLKKDAYSEMKSVYHADTNATYQTKFLYSLSVDSNGGRKASELSEDSYLVFRTRTEVDKEGNLLSAH